MPFDASAGSQPTLPLAMRIFCQLSTSSSKLTLVPSCSTNKSTLDADGELFTVIVGVKIIASLVCLV